MAVDNEGKPTPVVQQTISTVNSSNTISGNNITSSSSLVNNIVTTSLLPPPLLAAGDRGIGVAASIGTGPATSPAPPSSSNSSWMSFTSPQQQQQQQQLLQHHHKHQNISNGVVGGSGGGGGGGGGVSLVTSINENCTGNGINTNNNNNNNNTTSITTAKSETSSNASYNGSIKKNSTNGTMMNSREDITSLGGGSSINSHHSTNNNNIKGTKDNLHHHYFNSVVARNSDTDDVDDGLGPLPPKWEKAYTESGERYFIDHNTGSSHWLDPRLSKFQKKSLEDCMDDELPYGWEKIDDPQYGTYFIDHVNRRTQYENPVLEAKRRAERNRNDPLGKLQGVSSSLQTSLPYTFTRNPAEMRGERITTTLLKSSRGLGITIVGGDDNVDEFLQIKSIVPNGPAWLDGKLQTGDILVYVNDTCVLGFTHHEMVNVFQSILPGETATLEVCRGYPLPFDPNDPNTEVVTTIAVDGISSDPEKSRLLMDLNMDGNYNFLDISDSANGTIGGQLIPQKNPLAKIQLEVNENNHTDSNNMIMFKKPEILNIDIFKGAMGFGFTIADSAYGQKVKKILDRSGCKNLQESDILLEINNVDVKHMSHAEVVQVLKDCPPSKETTVKVQRGHYFSNINMNSRSSTGSGKLRKSVGGKEIIGSGLFRSKTPTADLYSTQQKEILPIRPKTPLVDTRRARVKTPSNELNEEVEAVTSGLDKNEETKSIGTTDAKSNNSLQEIDSINNDIPFMDPYPKLVSTLTERLAEASIYQHHQMDPSRIVGNGNYESQLAQEYGYNQYANHPQNNGSVSRNHIGGLYSPTMPIVPVPTYHQETCYCFECQDYNRYQYYQVQQHPDINNYHHHQHPIQQNGGRTQKRINDFMIDRRKTGFSPLETHMPSSHHQYLHQSSGQQYWNVQTNGQQGLIQPVNDDEYVEVTLERQALGFGFRIVGGTEEGSQVTVGHVVPGGAADGDPRISTGDEILSIDGVNVVHSSHHKVVSLMGEAALRGQVTMLLKRNLRNQAPVSSVRQTQYPYDVIVNRHENEGFGFVIISSSNQYYGSTIGNLISGSPADRCNELKVGDRIIAVNRFDIAGMSHGDVVNLIKESGLHVRLTIGCPKEGNPINPPQPSPPVNSHLKSDHHMTAPSNYFERSQMSQHHHLQQQQLQQQQSQQQQQLQQQQLQHQQQQQLQQQQQQQQQHKQQQQQHQQQHPQL